MSSATVAADGCSWRNEPELSSVSSQLEKELDRLDAEFWVSGEKLKEIVVRFQEELEEGMQGSLSAHVSSCHTRGECCADKIIRAQRKWQKHTHEP
jgi:hexokinase